MKNNSGMKRRIGLFVIFLLMVSLLSPISLFSQNYVSANSMSNSVDQFTLKLPQGTQISKWVLEESSGSIYALSDMQLFIIGSSDLTIQNTVDLGSSPTDLVVDDETIYIGFKGAHQFKTVNKLSGQIIDTFTTGRTVNLLEKMGDYIYYYSNDSYKIYRYDLVTKEQEELPLPTGVTRLSISGLDINEEKELLYLAGGNIFYALDLNDTTNLVSQMDVGGYNFQGPVIIDEEDVYFAARKFQADDLNIVKGIYSSHSEYHVDSILQVRDRYVITSRQIFDKESYRVIYSYSNEQLLAALDADNNLYTASYSEITKRKIDLPNLSYGEHITLDNKVMLRAPIVDQVFDDEYIYAITEDNTLVKINKNSLIVEAEVFVGSKPVNLFMQGKSIYIATQGASSISVIPDATADKLIVEKIQLPGVFPYAVAVYENNMFVSTGDLSSGAKGTLSYSFITKEFYQLKQGVFNVNTQKIKVAPESGKIYAGGFNVAEVYVISGESPNAILSRHYLSTNIGNMHIDGTSLYGGTKKYDLSNNFTLSATFPEKIIYAKEEYAFSSQAVYNSTSTIKQIDLPFEAGMIELDESGVVYMGRLDGTYYKPEVNQIYKFDSMQELVEYTNQFTPKNASFFDFEYTEGLVNGVVVFEPAEKDDEVAFYELIHLDNQLKKIGYIGRVEKADRLGNIYYKELNFYTQSNQKYIAVYAYSPFNNSGNTYRVSKYALTRIWDAPAYLAENISFTDNDSHSNQIGGTLSWQHSSGYKADDIYEVYFAGEDGLIGEPLATKSVNNAIQVQIPSGTLIPDKAIMLALVYKDPLVGFAPSYNVTPILDRMTRTLSRDDVQIDNKNGNQNDVITVRNLKQGETIHLYDEDEVWVKSETVAAGSSTVTMKVTHLNDLGGWVYLSVQMEGKAEGLIIVQTYGNAQSTTPPPSGGGGAIVITPPFGGGGFIPPSLVDLKQEESDDISAIEILVNSHKSADQVKVVAQIGSMKKYIEANKNLNVFEIQAVTNEAYNSLQYEIQYADLVDVQKELKGKQLELVSSFGRLRIGFDDLLQGLSPGSIIRVTIENAKEHVTETRAATTHSWSMVGVPVEYKVEVITNDQILEIQPKELYWGHILQINSSDVNLSKLAGVVFDSSTKSWLPVPSTFAKHNEQITGTLWRKGNSTYAIVQNEINFSDLPTSQESRDSIEKLANRLIINGYADGTFRPGEAVTRSEFATLLVKALGILPEGEATAIFSDVTTDHWFYNAASSAAQAKLIQGYGDGTFGPQQTITHTEMIVMLGNALAYIQDKQQWSETQKIQILSQLKMETNAPKWSEEALISITEKGIVHSRDHVIHSLTALTTREESAIYIFRLLKATNFIN